jgi:hypothetical protein
VTLIVRSQIGNDGNSPCAALVMSQRVHQLLDWCNQHGISLLNIMIVDCSHDPLIDDLGISVMALDDLSHSDIGRLPEQSLIE